MTPQQLKQRAEAEEIEKIVTELLNATSVAACKTAEDYSRFLAQVRTIYSTATSVFIAGSGNWGFSLSPEKLGRPFHERSDIDVGVIDGTGFSDTWEELRKYQRAFFYKIGWKDRDRLRQYGESVYCGYVSPLWIPDVANKFRWQHAKAMNNLSSALVGFKKVKLMFFKNQTETTDYYKRGLMILLRGQER